jgi:heterodisulfide reductase subunit A
LQTCVAGIFAGGDVVTGPNTVIDALAGGRRAAISIDRYIRKDSLLENREDEFVRESRLRVDTSGCQPERRLPLPELPVNARAGNTGEVQMGYSPEEAREEAARCLSCGCLVCIKSLGCPAIITEDDKVVIDSSQCPGCGICAQVCPAEAVVKE